MTAHATHASDGASGFAIGFTHPLYGLDHVAAMVAVGLWGAQLGNPAVWILPLAFPLVMALGSILGVIGVTLPLFELIITVSVVVFGALIALDKQLHSFLVYGFVSFFAVYHGYAHGIEMPGQLSQLGYITGFVLATGLIHLVGIIVGFIAHVPKGNILVRATGLAIGVIGLYLVWNSFL